MARLQIDGSGESAAKPVKSDKARRSASASGGNDRLKVIAAAVIGVFALGVIGYQVLPSLFGSTEGRRAATEPDLTEPVQPQATDLAPGNVETPVVPKPRGSGKRPAGG